MEAQIETEKTVCDQLHININKIENEIKAAKRENQEYVNSLQEKKVCFNFFFDFWTKINSK